VADKWTLLVIDALGEAGDLRFSRLRERVGGVSQKMLTKTLRKLERDGLVTRRVHAVVPPRVDYRLTPLGESLGEAVCGVWTWAEAHLEDVEQARSAYEIRGARRQGQERQASDG
jgi:DNA-binding HxlR family transcriptional regulator